MLSQRPVRIELASEIAKGLREKHSGAELFGDNLNDAKTTIIGVLVALASVGDAVQQKEISRRSLALDAFGIITATFAPSRADLPIFCRPQYRQP